MSGAVLATAPPHARHYRATWWASAITLLNIGGYTALFGPALPEFAEQAGVSVGATGAVYTALFGAVSVSTVVAGRAIDRFGPRGPIAVGLLVNAIGLMLTPFAQSWPLLLALIVLLGLGDGAVIVTTHVMAADLYPDQETAALNRLNILFSSGAIIFPSVAALVRAFDGKSVYVMAALGVAQLLLLLVFLTRPLAPHAAHAHGQRVPYRVLARAPVLWLLCAFLLVYVGVEVGLGGWAFTYAREAAGFNDQQAAVLVSGLWASLTAGRLFAIRFFSGVAASRLLTGGAAVAALGALVLLVAGSTPAGLVAGIVITGVGFGPLWPVTFAVLARAFPAASGSAGGLLVMVSAIGGLSFPLVQGFIFAQGGPTAAITVTFVGCVVAALITLGIGRVVGASVGTRG